MKTTPEQRRQWREIADAATPGPWEWFGNTRMREVYLATVDRGRVFVMDFARWGMTGAQPRFQVRLGEGGGIMRSLDELTGPNGPKMVAEHRKEFVGIAHPDAAFIAAARTAIPALLDDVAELEAEVDRLREKVSDMRSERVRADEKHKEEIERLKAASGKRVAHMAAGWEKDEAQLRAEVEQLKAALGRSHRKLDRIVLTAVNGRRDGLGPHQCKCIVDEAFVEQADADLVGKVGPK